MLTYCTKTATGRPALDDRKSLGEQGICNGAILRLMPRIVRPYVRVRIGATRTAPKPLVMSIARTAA